MAIPDLRINPYVTPYAPGPTQEFDSLIEQRIQDYDVAAEASDVLSYQNDALSSAISPFEGDRVMADSIMNNTRKQIKQWAAAGDYENMGRAIRKGARDFNSQIQPLLQNQQRYSSYLSDLQSKLDKGDIGLDTYTKAKALSTSSYKGLDPNNIAGSYFSGFTPTKDINLTDKVDNFLKGWKENGGTKFIPGTDGSYKEVNWESASSQDIAQAAQEALKGDSEVGSYFASQMTLGNKNRLDSEIASAINFGAEKYGFYKEKSNLNWMPEYAFAGKQAEDASRFINSVPVSAHKNLGSESVFKAMGLSQDKATGTIINTAYTESRNGKLYKFTDENGNTVSKQEYLSSNLPVGGREALGTNPEFGGTPPVNLRYKAVEITKEEAEEFTQSANNTLKDMAAQRYLVERVGKDLSLESYNNNPQAVQEFLERNISQYTSKQYLNDTYDRYEKAIKNSAVINSNRRFPISVIAGGTSNREFTSLKDDELMLNALGQEAVVLSSEGIGSYKQGDEVDINSVVDKLAEEGYTWEKGIRLGVLFNNPSSTNKPGISNGLMFKDKDGKTKMLEVAISTEDPQLQPVQDVYSAAYKGTPYTEIPMGNDYTGKFVVRTATVPDGKGSYKFNSVVEIRDANGKRQELQLPDGSKQAAIPIENFGDFYKNQFAPDMLVKYLNPKFR